MSGIFQGLMNFIQTAFASFSDNFNRSNSGSLGTSSSGGVWNVEKGVWGTDGKAAQSYSSPSTYPLADINMTSSNNTSSISVGSNFVFSVSGTISTVTATTSGYTVVITGLSSTSGLSAGQFISATAGTGSLGTPTDIQIVSVDSASQITLEVQGSTPTTGTITNVSTRNNDGGSGIALWITDSGNWWGVTYGRSTNTSCNCSTCATYSCSGYTNYITGSYCGAYAYSVSVSCTGGYSYATNYGITSYSYLANYGIANYAYSAYTPCGTYTNPCSTYATTYGSYYASGSPICTNYSYSCSAYGTTYAKSGNYYYVSHPCTTYINGCITYLPTYNVYTTSTGSTCTAYGAATCSAYLSYVTGPNAVYGVTSYTTPANYGISGYSGPNCNSYTNNYYGPACTVYYSTYAPYCSSPVYGYTSCNCQTCFPSYIRLIQSSGNVVSEITRWSLSQLSAAFKVITNSVTKVITIRTYKETSLTNQIGADFTYTATSATIGNKFGIVLGPSDYVQGNQLDDFNSNSN
jgi:hypothetical protein